MGRGLRTAGWAIFGLAVTFAFLARVPAIAEPLGIDQGLWAAVARGLSRGQVLYVDLWDHKPPAIFLTYLAAFSLFGWTPAAVAWMDIAAAAIMCGLLFLVARRLDMPVTGRLAAALYATLTIPSWLYGHGGFLERSVNETFIMLLVGAAAWCAALFVERGRLLWLAALGVPIGFALTFKPTAVVYAPALFIWSLAFVQPRARRGQWVRGLFALSVGLTVGPACLIWWLWNHGILYEGWVASVGYNLSYVADTPGGSSHIVAYAKAIFLRIKTDPLWLAGGIGSIVAGVELLWRRRLDRLPSLAIAWGAAAAAAIYANGAWLFNNYFVQALAPLALLAAWLLAGFWRRSWVHRPAAVAAAVLMLALVVTRNYPARVFEAAAADVGALLGRGDRAAYLDRFGGYGNGRGYSARANDELERFIAANSRQDDRLYLFGINGTETYFVTGRLPAQRLLRVNYFIPGTYPDPRYRVASVVDDLAKARPLFIVFETLHSRSTLGQENDRLVARPDVSALLRGYRLDAQIEDFAVYRRLD